MHIQIINEDRLTDSVGNSNDVVDTFSQTIFAIFLIFSEVVRNRLMYPSSDIQSFFKHESTEALYRTLLFKSLIKQF